MYIPGIGQIVLKLLSFKVGSGNHQRGISFLQKFSDIFGNMRLVPLNGLSDEINLFWHCSFPLFNRYSIYIWLPVYYNSLK